MSYALTIITPDGKVFDDQVEELVAPGEMGSFGVLKQHAPMVAALKKGVLKLKTQGQENFWSVAQGVLEVSDKGQVLILVDRAEKQ